MGLLLCEGQGSTGGGDPELCSAGQKRSISSAHHCSHQTQPLGRSMRAASHRQGIPWGHPRSPSPATPPALDLLRAALGAHAHVPSQCSLLSSRSLHTRQCLQTHFPKQINIYLPKAKENIQTTGGLLHRAYPTPGVFLSGCCNSGRGRQTALMWFSPSPGASPAQSSPPPHAK